MIFSDNSCLHETIMLRYYQQEVVSKLIDHLKFLYETNSGNFVLVAVFLILLSGFILGLIIFLIVTIIQHIHNAWLRRFICKNSTAIRSLLAYNKSLSNEFFLPVRSPLHCSKSVHNRRAFNNFSHRNFLKEYFEKHRDYLVDTMQNVEHNCVNYSTYCEYCEKLFSERSIDWYGKRNFSIKEKALFDSLMLRPVVSLTIITHCKYTTPAGRHHYHSRDVFYLADLRSVQTELQNETEFEQSKRYQRSIMSDSLRYDIMKRDGFTCTLCGATRKDGAKLQVDHIIPIAKGGKTIPSNLRTLCDRCNLGKSDKYDPCGPN